MAAQAAVNAAPLARTSAGRALLPGADGRLRGHDGLTP
jgi:hypothetical protein